MKIIVDCDFVFDTLTAGPVTARDASAMQITEHLEACDTCRDFADAMRPACHLLHEALPVDQRGDLPVFLPTDDAAVMAVMQQIATAPVPANSATTVARAKSNASSGWKSPASWLGTTSLLATAAAACLLLLVAGPWLFPGRTAANRFSPNETLLAMQLPNNCLTLAMVKADGIDTPHPSVAHNAKCETCHAPLPAMQSGGDSIAFACCTNCHTASQYKRTAVPEMSRLLVACQTCHSGS